MDTKSVVSLSLAAVILSAQSVSALRAETPAREFSSIQDLIRFAAENNRELAALRQRMPEARGVLRQAYARPAPLLELSGATGRPLATVGEEQFGASYGYTVETGGKRSRRVTVAELGIALAQSEYQERLRQISYDLKILYADAVALQRKLERQLRLIEINKESMRLTQARVQEGDAAPLERNLLEVELGRGEAARSSAAGQLDATLIELSQLVGLVPLEKFSLPQHDAGSTTVDIQALQARAGVVRPDIKLARLIEQQGQADLRLAIAQGAPDVTLSASFARVFSRFDDQFGTSPAGNQVQLRDRDDIVTVGVQVPLGTRSRNRGNVESSSARAAAARLRREYLERRVEAEVAAAAHRLVAAQSRLSILEVSVVGQSEQNLAVIRQAYQLGQFRLLDVLAEQRRVLENQLSYVEAQTEVAKSAAELERAVGEEIR